MLGRLSRILVVDGNAVSRETTHRLLLTLGYQTIDFAPDGRSALRLMSRNNYRLVLADWDMTPVDGQELLKQARLDQRSRYLPFLMAIGRWQKKFIEIVRDDGATLYLTKPLTVEILSERMTQVYSDASRLRDARAPAPSTGLMSAPHVGSTVPSLWQYLRPD